MTSEALAYVIWSLSAVAWVCAAFLVHKAWDSGIGALNERAVIAIGIAGFGTVCSIVTYNTDVTMLFTAESVRFWFRFAVVLLLLLPVVWAVLYMTGSLGDDGRGL